MMEIKKPEEGARGDVRNRLNRIDKIVTWIIAVIFLTVLVFMFVYYAFG